MADKLLKKDLIYKILDQQALNPSVTKDDRDVKKTPESPERRDSDRRPARVKTDKKESDRKPRPVKSESKNLEDDHKKSRPSGDSQRKRQMVKDNHDKPKH